MNISLTNAQKAEFQLMHDVLKGAERSMYPILGVCLLAMALGALNYFGIHVPGLN